MIAAVTAAFLPDIDWPFYIFANKLLLIKYHRWILNSIFCVPIFAVILAYVFVRISKIRQFWVFFWICLIVLFSHLLLDLATSYGTMILSPFSDRRFALDLLFIIDPLFSGMLLTALILSYFWKRRATSICSLSLVFVTLYVGLCGICHHKALTLAKRFAREPGIISEKIASLPQPTSPFKWVNLIETDEVVYQGYLDLLRKPGQRRRSHGNSFFEGFFSSYYSPSEIKYRAFEKQQSSPWLKRALALDDVRFFYKFARFPIARYRRVNDGHVVQFVDLRFSAPGIRNPFGYVVKFSEEGQLIKQELE